MADVDLELKQLENFHCSEEYHEAWLGVLATDGVKYVMENGYSYFVTDAISALKAEPRLMEYLSDNDFVVIRLLLNKHAFKGTQVIPAQLQMEDGDGNVLYAQDYQVSDAKRELTLYYSAGVLMLSGEY